MDFFFVPSLLDLTSGRVSASSVVLQCSTARSQWEFVAFATTGDLPSASAKAKSMHLRSAKHMSCWCRKQATMYVLLRDIHLPLQGRLVSVKGASGLRALANSDEGEMKPWLLLGSAFGFPDPLLLQTKTELLAQDDREPGPRCWDHALSCWDCEPQKGHRAKQLFYLHISKTAGCSAVADLSRMVGRRNMFSYETCYEWASEYNFSHSFVIFRRPRDLVLSAYNFCAGHGRDMPKTFQESLSIYRELNAYL